MVAYDGMKRDRWGVALSGRVLFFSCVQVIFSPSTATSSLAYKTQHLSCIYIELLLSNSHGQVLNTLMRLEMFYLYLVSLVGITPSSVHILPSQSPTVFIDG